MAKFMGTLRGNGQEVTRLGHRRVEVVAASWEGAGRACAFGNDELRLEMTPWHGKGRSLLLYEGPASGDWVRGQDVAGVLGAARAVLEAWRAEGREGLGMAMERLERYLGEPMEEEEVR